MPERIQLSRRKGWRMPANTLSVARPTRWGNPFRVIREGGFMWVEPGGKHIVCSTDREANTRERRAEAVELYRTRWIPLADVSALRAELGGKNLACWCPLGSPCHADVLLELANS